MSLINSNIFILGFIVLPDGVPNQFIEIVGGVRWNLRECWRDAFAVPEENQYERHAQPNPLDKLKNSCANI